MEHTPEPWTVKNQGQHIEVWAAPSLRIARIGIYADNSCGANARFIVRAVNNHAALLEALEVLYLASEGVKLSRSSETMTALSTAASEARAAILAAKGD